jgi:hypothetical protein
MIFVESIMDRTTLAPVINSSNKGADLDYGCAGLDDEPRRGVATEYLRQIGVGSVSDVIVLPSWATR